MALFIANASAQNAPQEAEYFRVQQNRRASEVSLGGSVIPHKEVTLAAQLPGRVVHISGIEGNFFKKGTILIALDTAELLAARRAAEAQMMNANAQLYNAGVQYNREIWSPRANASPGGMGVPSLFDQMFTRPMESWSGNRQYGAERYSDIFSSRANIEKARSAIAQLH
ncbi:RND transporter, partial [Achromatium sp. WMS1]